MPEIDREILDRAMRWCAESGRPVHEDVVRHALTPLGWDELLAVKAILADPPPARDLGPADLLALSRGGPAPRPSATSPRAARKATGRSARPARAAAAPRIRRARDRVEATSPSPVSPPSIDLLYRESGRAVLDRLVRQRGANRTALLAALGAGWSAGGGAPTSADLDRLLAHHGLARGFAERERALLLHAFRKHGGVLIRVARELGAAPAELRASLARLELAGPVEAVREARRKVLDRKGTLADRARLVDEEEEALLDLGLLPRFEEDLKKRLPEQLRALSVGGRRPSAADLGRSLSLSRGAVDRLAARFSLPLRPAPPERPERRDRPDRRDARAPGARPGGPRPTGARPAGRRPPADRPPRRDR
ncbi:MAG: hypothetical protein RJA59_1661 [Pseudomonadota bacterium]